LRFISRARLGTKCVFIEQTMCFGSKADIVVAKRHVRFAAKADMCSARGHVCYGPRADIAAYSITSLARASSVCEPKSPSAPQRSRSIDDFVGHLLEHQWHRDP
jgi:hypothetical protein